MHFPKLALLCVLTLTACLASGASSDTVRLSTPRAAHASVVLDDGRVLLIGGCVRDGCEVGPKSASVDLFDPADATIVPAGQLLTPRVSPRAARLPDGRILLVGGWEAGRASASAEIFDPATGRSEQVGGLSTTSGDVSIVTLADGRILVAGGFDGRRRLAGAEIFDPATATFTPTEPLNEARSSPESVLLADGRVLIVGGVAGGRGATVPLASVEIFDPRTGRFTVTGAMAEARFKHAALRLTDGRVLVVAGSDERGRDGKKQTLEIYDPGRGEFISGGKLIDARFKLPDAVALLPDGRVLIAGGARHPEIYDPAAGESRAMALNLGRSWNFMTASALPDGRVLLAGGYSEMGLEVSDRTWIVTI